jgi:hypothetical protein
MWCFALNSLTNIGGVSLLSSLSSIMLHVVAITYSNPKNKLGKKSSR